MFREGLHCTFLVFCVFMFLLYCILYCKPRMWANAQPDGRPAEHRWRPLFNAAKFG